MHEFKLSSVDLNILINALQILQKEQERMAPVVQFLDSHQVDNGRMLVERLIVRLKHIRGD